MPVVSVEARRVDQRRPQNVFESPEDAKQRQDAIRSNELLQRLHGAGLFDRFANASLDNFDHIPKDARAMYAEVVMVLRAGITRPGAIIGLVGNPGPGKTYIASGLVRELCIAGKSARYTTTDDYFQAIKAEFKRGGNEAAVDERYRGVALLVLDEIQVRGDTPWENRQLSKLIDHRYAKNRSTILVGNPAAGQTPVELVASLGDRIEDRIHDGGGIVVCNWASLRGRLG